VSGTISRDAFERVRADRDHYYMESARRKAECGVAELEREHLRHRLRELVEALDKWSGGGDFSGATKQERAAGKKLTQAYNKARSLTKKESQCPTCGSKDRKNFDGYCGDRYLATGIKTAADPWHWVAEEKSQ
jgi:hypothetical protein